MGEVYCEGDNPKTTIIIDLLDAKKRFVFKGEGLKDLNNFQGKTGQFLICSQLSYYLQVQASFLNPNGIHLAATGVNLFPSQPFISNLNLPSSMGQGGIIMKLKTTSSTLYYSKSTKITNSVTEVTANKSEIINSAKELAANKSEVTFTVTEVDVQKVHELPNIIQELRRNSKNLIDNPSELTEKVSDVMTHAINRPEILCNKGAISDDLDTLNIIN